MFVPAGDRRVNMAQVHWARIEENGDVHLYYQAGDILVRSEDAANLRIFLEAEAEDFRKLYVDIEE